MRAPPKRCGTRDRNINEKRRRDRYALDFANAGDNSIEAMNALDEETLERSAGDLKQIWRSRARHRATKQTAPCIPQRRNTRRGLKRGKCAARELHCAPKDALRFHQKPGISGREMTRRPRSRRNKNMANLAACTASTARKARSKKLL